MSVKISSRKNTTRNSSKRRVKLCFHDDEGMPISEKHISVTQQNFRDEVEINNVISRYIKTGLAVQRDPNKALYGDFSDLPDMYQMHEMSQKLNELSEQFNQLSSLDRKKFDNDPEKMVDFIANPDNLEEAVNMGLLPKGLLKKPDNKAETTQKEPKTAPEA